MILSFKDKVYGEVKTAAWTAIEQKSRNGIVIAYAIGRESRSHHLARWTMENLDTAIEQSAAAGRHVCHVGTTPPKEWERD